MVKTAFIFAAGLGTRLKPLTDHMPKALVPYMGKPMLQSLIEKLKAAGFERILINVHHFADQIEDFIAEHDSFGLEILFSDERELLRDTGGGIRQLSSFFTEKDPPFLVHNCDIISNIDLKDYYDSQLTGGELKDHALVSLVVSQRNSSRSLLFDTSARLCAWHHYQTGQTKSPFPFYQGLEPEKLLKALNPLSFNGIHIISPRIFTLMKDWPDRFSIIDFYLDICRQEVIKGWVAPDSLHFKDIGKISSLNNQI